MKRRGYFVFITVSTAIILAFIGCSKDDVNDQLPDYTIMLYGCGGGDLDSYFFENFKQCVIHGSTDKIKMTFLFKFSKALKDSVDVGTMKGTARFVLGEKQDTAGFNCFAYPATTIADDTYPLYKSESLTDFIKWNVENYPARNYILLLWNHGRGWSAKTDTLLQTKSVISDDNVEEKSLSLEQLVEGVRNSGIQLKAIISDACFMAMYENLGDYASVADYYVGSVEETPAFGSRYDWLLDHIAASGESNDNFWNNMSNYCNRLTDYWVQCCPLESYTEEDIDHFDCALIDLKGLPYAYSIIKKITGELVSNADSYQSAHQLAAQNATFDYQELYDSGRYFDELAAASGREIMNSLANEYSAALSKFMYISIRHLDYEVTLKKVSIGLNIMDKDKYEELNAGRSYEYLTFDKETGWSNWLKSIRK